jgi:hypothetical protein
MLAALDARFRGGERSMGNAFQFIRSFPRIAVRKDGVLPHAYGGNPVFERWAGRDEIWCRLMPKNGPFSELAVEQ